MSDFLFMNLQDYSCEQGKALVESTSDNYCICCLGRQVSFVSLTKCVHGSYLENFALSKILSGQKLVCLVCHSILRKIERFRQTVEDSFHILSTKTHKLQQQQLIHRMFNLHQQPIQIIDSTLPELPAPKPEKTNTTELEIKLEIEEYFSDADSDIPLCEIKKEDSKSSKKVVRKKKKLASNEIAPQKVSKSDQISKYEGKIRSVMLTDEELTEERIKEAKSPGYLKLPYKCESCIIGFDYEYTLKAHHDRKHPELSTGTFKCNICKSILNSDASYKDHIRRHYRRFECCECSKRYVHHQTTVKHYNQVHAALAVTTYRCRKCDFTTESHRVYRYHLEKHKGGHQCAECGNTFVNSSGLKVHIHNIHKPSTRVFSCPPCGKVYRSRSGLCQHVSACHAGGGSAYCAECDAHFKTRRNLLLHVRTARAHRAKGDERFVCGDCNAGFITRGLLKQHVDWKHLRNTPHKCAKCDNKSFRSRSDLAKHTDRVHLKKPQPRNKICDYCGRGFTIRCVELAPPLVISQDIVARLQRCIVMSIAILRAHIRTHTGERPLQCAHCAATFAHPAAKYTHTRLVHAQHSS